MTDVRGEPGTGPENTASPGEQQKEHPVTASDITSWNLDDFLGPRTIFQDIISQSERALFKSLFFQTPSVL